MRSHRQVLQEMGIPVEGRRNPVAEALNEEGQTVERAVSDEDLLNRFYIGAGRGMEQTEQTTYDNPLRMADQLDVGDTVTEPLEQHRDSGGRALKTLRKQTRGSDLESLWERFAPSA